MDETIGLATASSDVDFFVGGVVVADIAVSPSSLVAIFSAGIVVPLRELVLVPSWRRALVDASDPVLGCFSTRLIVVDVIPLLGQRLHLRWNMEDVFPLPEHLMRKMQSVFPLLEQGCHLRWTMEYVFPVSDQGPSLI